MKAIMAIQADTSLTNEEKAHRRQALLSGKFHVQPPRQTSPRAVQVAGTNAEEEEEEDDDTVLESLKCSICFDLCRQVWCLTSSCCVVSCCVVLYSSLLYSTYFFLWRFEVAHHIRAYLPMYSPSRCRVSTICA